jgi:Domain of unknown function (DUF4349)
MSLRRDEETTLDPQAERELDALEAALRGEPVGPGYAHVAELAAALAELRATPEEEFAARLDTDAAAGFRAGGSDSTPERLRARLRGHSLRQAMPALAGATAALLIGTAVVVGLGQQTGDDAADSPATMMSEPASGGATDATAGEEAAPQSAAAKGPVATPLDARTSGTGPNAADERRRFQDRDAGITLATEADQVRRATEDVFDVVARYRGIVRTSQIEDGLEGEAGARFELLIPSSRLSAALGDLSEIAEVRSREETSVDITAPVVTVGERLQDARAEVRGLLKQLAEADTDEERAAVKAQLAFQRQRVASLRSTLSGLERRANLANVSLEIVTGDAAGFGESEDEQWTIADAIDDAGRILAVAAAIALVSLAVVAPLALLFALALLGRRAWVRQSRERALDA